MSERSATQHRGINALLVAVLLLSIPGTGLLALGFLLSGLATAGGGRSSAMSLSESMIIYGSGLAFVASLGALCWRGLAPRISHFTSQYSIVTPDSRSRQSRTATPAYSWTCHVCEASNPPGKPTCVACGHASCLSMAEVAAAREGLPANRRHVNVPAHDA